MYFKNSRKDKTSCISWTDPVVVCHFCDFSDTELCWIILYFALKSGMWTAVGISFIKHFGKFFRILSSLISLSRIWLYNCRYYNGQRVALCHPGVEKYLILVLLQSELKEEIAIVSDPGRHWSLGICFMRFAKHSLVRHNIRIIHSV